MGRQRWCCTRGEHIQAVVRLQIERGLLLQRASKYPLSASGLSSSASIWLLVVVTWRIFSWADNDCDLEQVLKLLDILSHQIRKTSQILRGDRLPFEDILIDSDSDTCSAHQPGLEDTGMEDESPWKFHQTRMQESRSPSLHRQRASRVPSYLRR